MACRMVAVACMGLVTILLLAVTASDHHPAHRVADVKKHASRTRECERNREKNREKASRHDQPNHSMYFSAMEWTCPMHPEVVRPQPGDCPICGMALEPKAFSSCAIQRAKRAGCC